MIFRSQADALQRRLFKMPPRARRFVRPGMTVHDFLSELTRLDARYAVLRWFDELPRVEPGEDLDLLIGDEHLHLIEPLLSPYEPLPATQKVDLYSVSGMRGTDYRGVPYLARNLALSILDNAVLLHGHYKVPSTLDHLNSLAFHAAYHKGEHSGLPERAGMEPTVRNSEHDYRQWLERLSKAAGKPLEVTLDGLDRYLTNEGYRPAADLLERYQRRNNWLQKQLAAERGDIGKAAGLVSFFVRERALPCLHEIIRQIDKHGFEVLHSFKLEPDEVDRVRRGVRGGNWEQGPFPLSGGDPVWLILTYDFGFDPTPASDGMLLNRNTSLTKRAIRRLIERSFPPEQWFNPVHSTDHGWQTLESLHVLGREGLSEQLAGEVARLERALQPPWPVVQVLPTNARRARVLVVDHPDHGRCVAKVFRPSAQRFLEREMLARREFRHVGVVPPVLEHGPNWYLSPFYKDTGAHVLRGLPGSRQVQLSFATIMRLAAFVKELRAKGSFLLDLSSHNLITDPQAGLLVLDLEFLQAYDGPAPPLDQDATVCGRPPPGNYDTPVYEVEDRWDLRVRTSVFHPAICGLPAGEFFADRPSAGLRSRMALAQQWWWLSFAFHQRWRSISRRRFVTLPRGLLKYLRGR